ncbi:MAG: PBP1A family penicillin-binding protein [Deltaproteobacteria bacterium]|nr:PBP1A family penicillin-binding protein [Deltaproteobacteria bacterium]
MRRGRESPAKKPKRTLRERIRRWWRIVKWTTILGSLAFTGGWWYLHHLGGWAERYFSRSFTWKVPSRIYSDVEYLYPGLDVTQRLLRDKLDRLGYRDTGAAAAAAGEYVFAKDRIDLYLHDFDYPNERFVGFPLRVKLSGGAIQEITHLKTAERLTTVRLEPELIGSVFDEKMEDRTLVKLQQVPDLCLLGVVTIEDERFFRHGGMDPWGILRAMWNNLKAMRVVEGGSTLTQQLVKNYFLTQDRTWRRKLNEALIALAIEQRHSKAEILEAYVNEIYLGQRGASSVSGFGEAARLYFGKEIAQLDASECALLSGMIRGPGRYNPFLHPEAAKDRRNFVIARLREQGYLNEADAAKAAAAPIVTPRQARQLVQAPFFLDFVKQQLHELYPEERLVAEGLRIFTSLDVSGQLIAEQAVAEGLADLEQRFAAKLPKDHAGQLQGAFVSLQPQTGYIRTMVGGRSYADTQFNRVTQAKRQPGSTFKPFVYLTAFDPQRSQQPFAPSSYIEDISFTIQSGGKDWTPHNYDQREHGPLPAREALIHSYNIATARLAIDAGLEAVVQTAQDAGIGSTVQAVPSMALGSFEVTPLELATAYTIFANNGMLAHPLAINGVVTAQGEVLERKTIGMERRFDPGPVYLVTETLKDVLTKGTAASAGRLGFKGLAAGKTGTTSDYRDAWFVGFTPELVALSWVGYDDNTSTHLSGGTAALPIWVRYMRDAQPANSQDFPMPKNVILVKIDPVSGKAWTKDCPEAIFAPFVEGAEPTEECPVH